MSTKTISLPSLLMSRIERAMPRRFRGKRKNALRVEIALDEWLESKEQKKPASTEEAA